MNINAFLYASADWWLQSNICKSAFEQYERCILKLQPLRAVHHFSMCFLLSLRVEMEYVVNITLNVFLRKYTGT